MKHKFSLSARRLPLSLALLGCLSSIGFLAGGGANTASAQIRTSPTVAPTPTPTPVTSVGRATPTPNPDPSTVKATPTPTPDPLTAPKPTPTPSLVAITVPTNPTAQTTEGVSIKIPFTRFEPTPAPGATPSPTSGHVPAQAAKITVQPTGGEAFVMRSYIFEQPSYPLMSWQDNPYALAEGFGGNPFLWGIHYIPAPGFVGTDKVEVEWKGVKVVTPSGEIVEGGVYNHTFTIEVKPKPAPTAATGTTSSGTIATAPSAGSS